MFDYLAFTLKKWWDDSEFIGPPNVEPNIWGNEEGLDIGIIDTFKIVVLGYLALAVYSEFKSPTRKSTNRKYTNRKFGVKYKGGGVNYG